MVKVSHSATAAVNRQHLEKSKQLAGESTPLQSVIELIISTTCAYVARQKRETCCKGLDLYENELYNTNFSRGGNFRYIREFGFCAKFSSRENNIHCEWNFAKFSSRDIFLPRNFSPRENEILIAV